MSNANEGCFQLLVRHFGLCWSLCKVRKETVCYLTGRRIMAGTLAYRPITNGKMRMHRIKANPTGHDPARSAAEGR